jgi:hypothetical protein
LILFPPSNKYLIHDVGAFQIGIGVTALFGTGPNRCSDGVSGTLSARGELLRADHVVDRHLGGHSEDVIGLGLLAVLAVLGLALTFGGRLLSVNPIAATAKASNEAPERRAHLFSVADP